MVRNMQSLRSRENINEIPEELLNTIDTAIAISVDLALHSYCPRCGSKRIEVNTDIKQNKIEKIKLKCKDCGYEWEPFNYIF